MSSWDCPNCGLTNSALRNQCLACFTSERKEIETLVDQGENIELLICGYVRENEITLRLFMNIPDGIVQIMHSLYPLLLFKFGDHKQGQFTLGGDGTTLKGNGDSCKAYLVYADLQQNNDIGLNKGIHIWSIKTMLEEEFADCYCAIGVTPEKNQKIIDQSYSIWDNVNNDFVHWLNGVGNNEGNDSYLNISRYSEANTVTMKLNCDNWTVVYYVDGKEVKMDDIQPNREFQL